MSQQPFVRMIMPDGNAVFIQGVRIQSNQGSPYATNWLVLEKVGGKTVSIASDYTPGNSGPPVSQALIDLRDEVVRRFINAKEGKSVDLRDLTDRIEGIREGKIR